MSKLTDKLQALAAKLSESEQKSLLEYTEFMVSRSTHTPEQVSNIPLEILRPIEETVVGAMKRLSKTYPMLNMDKLLHDASGLMSEHIMKGRAALEVIDELQALFEKHYQNYTDETE